MRIDNKTIAPENQKLSGANTKGHEKKPEKSTYGTGDSSAADAAAVATISSALLSVSRARDDSGADSGSLEYDSRAQNLLAAESRIRDADMAKLFTEITKENMLRYASQALSAQANVLPENVMQLLNVDT